MLIVALASAACSASGGGGSPGGSSSVLPLLPSAPTRDLGPTAPPLVWVSGTIVDAGPNHVDVRGVTGSVVSLGRLAGGATLVYTVDGDRWRKLADDVALATGQRVCVESLETDSRLLAVRVFVGAGCGPTA